MIRTKAAMACCLLATLVGCTEDGGTFSSTSDPIDANTFPVDTVLLPDEELTPLTAGDRFQQVWPGEVCGTVPAGEVALLDPATGDEVWRVATPRSSSSRLVTDGVLAWHVTNSSTNSNGLVAFEVATGEPVWQRRFAPSLFDVQLTSTTLVATTSNGLVAYDPRTGVERWRRVAAAGTGFAFGQLIDVFGELPVGDTVYANDGGTLVALDAATGDVRWQRATDGDWSYSPGVLDGTLWHVAYEREVYSIDATLGTVNWKWTADASVTLNSILAIDDTTVVVTTVPRDPAVTAQLVGLDRASGDVRWSSPLSDPYGAVRALPTSGLLLHGGTATEGDLTAIAIATGEVLWQGGADALGYFNTSLDTVPPVVALSGTSPEFKAIDPSSGSTVWSIDGAATALSAEGDSLFVGVVRPSPMLPATHSDDDGAMVALSVTTGQPRWTTTFSYSPQTAVLTDGGLLVWAPAPAVGCS